MMYGNGTKNISFTSKVSNSEPELVSVYISQQKRASLLGRQTTLGHHLTFHSGSYNQHHQNQH